MIFHRILKNIKTIDEIEEENRMKEQEILKGVQKKQSKIDEANSLIAQVLEHETVMSSPIDGSPISMVRTDDIIPLICDQIGLDEEDRIATNYPEFFR
jgi:hypothetical protein